MELYYSFAATRVFKGRASLKDSGCGETSTREQFLHHFLALLDDADRPAVARGEVARVVDGKRLADCGHEVDRARRPLDNLSTVLVGLADGLAPFDAAAGQERGPRFRVVIAAALLADLGGAAKIAHPDHERRIRSEEHTSELQSLRHLVCRLLL